VPRSDLVPTGEGNDIPFIFFSEDGSGTSLLDALNGGANFFLERRPDGRPQHAELLRIAEMVATEHKERVRLRLENQVMTAILQASPLGICVIQNHAITYANATLERVLGYDNGYLVGMDPHVLVPDSEAHSRIDDGLFGASTPTGWKSVNSRVRHRDGSVVQCHLVSRAIDPSNPDLGYIVIGQDITQYEQMRDLLRKSERRYEDLLEGSHSIIVRLDMEGRIRFINRYGQAFFGFSAEEIVGKHVVGTIVPSRSRTGRDLSVMIRDILENPEDNEVRVNENIKKDGERVWIAWTNKPIRDEQGRITEVLSIGNDITERGVQVRDRDISVAPWKWKILEGTDIDVAVFEAVYAVSMEISREGREGKSVGTAFLVGDAGAVLARSRQLILNPFEGHLADLRRITNPDLKETIKELSQLDGAFVIHGDGIVEAAARYITIDTSDMPLQRGWGTRHASVAGITSATNAIGIVVSQSGGRISIFRGGRAVKIVAVSE
jgi:PAS domain S-box-containing protein